MQIHEALKAWRKHAGLNQTQVANSIGMQQQQYSRYEKGSNMPPADIIKTIATTFKVSADVLLGITVYDDN